MVDKRTLEKYEKEAKEKNRETWYLAWSTRGHWRNTRRRQRRRTGRLGTCHGRQEDTGEIREGGKGEEQGDLVLVMVDKRTLEKYEKEAKEKNRETWYLS